jgi:hypothetical protein
LTTAKITNRNGFQCAPDGHTVVNFPLGETVCGKVAEWALASHAAQRMFDPRTDTQQDTPTLETKAPPKKRRRSKKQAG